MRKICNRSVDITNHRFGRWTALYRSRRGKREAWHCRCDCGTEKTVAKDLLTRQQSKSCGCLRREYYDSPKKHGFGHHPLIKTWYNIRDRCYNPATPGFSQYGGRGIKVCSRWLEGEDGKSGIQCFIEDMGDKPSLNHSIDRIDVNGHYEPSNVRWATRSEQQHNKRNNRILSFRGETRCVGEWAKITGIHRATIFSRIRSGWTVERILTPPPKRHHQPPI